MRSGHFAVACGFTLGCATLATADINYGDFAGTDFNFLNVTESSGTDPEPLYNAPGVFGNTLDFDPTMNSAADGFDADITDAQINMMIESIEGVGIGSLSFSEAGDTSLIGTGTAATATAVAATFFVEILEVDGVGIDPVSDIFMMSFSPSAGDFNLDDDGNLVGQAWTGSLLIDIQAMLDAVDIDGNATLVSLVFDNILTASAEDGTASVIAKKDSSVTVAQIPAPGALMLLGAASLMARRRPRA